MKIGIVGCGINGAYLAWRLAKEHDVVVFEKNKTIGEKACSGLVSERIWDFIPKNKKIVQNVIDEAIVHFPKKDIKLKFHPKMLVLNRKKLDKYVAKLAEENGAQINFNSQVKRLYYLKYTKPQVSVSGNVFEFDYLIGCDGFSSIVRKTIGVPDPKFCLGIYTYLNKKSKSNKVDVYPLKNGFAWIIPRGSKIEYGISENVNLAKKEFQKFCKTKRIKPRKIYSSIIPEALVQAEAGRIALSGDAIGLIKPLSLGGILWGMIADNILVKSFPDFEKYDHKLRDFFEPKILFSRIGDKIGRFFGYKIPWLLPDEIYFDSDWIY